MRNRKWKRKVKELRQELPPSVPIDRGDRLSAIVPIDRICVEGEEQYDEDAAFDKLCASVKRNGVLQPLLVRRICEEDSPFGGVYLLNSLQLNVYVKLALQLLACATIYFAAIFLTPLEAYRHARKIALNVLKRK